MSEPLQIQIILTASPDNIFRALTDELSSWFSEYADVSLDEHRYDFWGRFTPDAPGREGGKHSLSGAHPGSHLTYDWTVRSTQTTVQIRLQEKDGKTALLLHQNGSSGSHGLGDYTFEDFWFLSLENLRRHLDRKRPVFCDFSTLPATGDVRHTVEIDAPREVVYEALIKPEQLNRWIASNAVIEPRVGGVYDIGWGEFGHFKILELVPNEKLAYSGSEEPGGPEMIVTWVLEGSGGKTRLTLVHSGFAPDTPNSGLQAGWLNFTSWVKSVAEYGAEWQPAIKLINPEMYAYYPASVSAAQSLWTDAP